MRPESQADTQAASEIEQQGKQRERGIESDAARRNVSHTFTQGVVFGYEYDNHLRGALRNRKSIETMLDTAPFKELLAEMAVVPVPERQDEAKPQEDAVPAIDVGDQPLAETGTFQAMIKQMGCDDQERVLKFQMAASNLVASHVEFACEASHDMAAAMRRSPAFTTVGWQEAKTHRAIILDPKVLGESSAHPHIRVAPLRANGDHVQSLVKTVLAETGGIESTDLWFIFDAGRQGRWAYVRAVFDGVFRATCLIARVVG